MDILAEKHDWISRQLRRLDELERREPVLGLDRPGVIWLHGVAIPIELHEGESRPTRGPTAELENGVLVLGGHGMRVDEPVASEDAITHWYRREARARIERHVADEAPLLGVVAAKLTIRDPKTRWASCSAKASLSFSWRLLLAPFEVLDYVVVHELCHLHELNHSNAFWALVKEARPNYRDPFDWLREHGEELHAYTPLLPPARETIGATGVAVGAHDDAPHAVTADTPLSLF
jgi:predicted metal-dependent hydrolase